MIAFIPNDRSLARLPAGTVLQTGDQAERMLQKKLRALVWLRNSKPRAAKLRRRHLRAVS